MAVNCVCIPVIQVEGTAKKQSPVQKKDHKPRLNDQIDVCKILERTQDKSNRHNDFECHYAGEKRQNLINKLQMYLNDIDDRPVMKGHRRGGAGGGSAKGVTGFGPLIKYPGYVDYGHPYFSDPYDKMPELATSASKGRKGVNVCPPLSSTEWAERSADSRGPQTMNLKDFTAGHGAGLANQDGGKMCKCAARRGDTPTCHNAFSDAGAYSSSSPGPNKNKNQQSPTHTPAAVTVTYAGEMFCCTPLP